MIDLIYLLPLRYPTEKAYGVTIGNTLSCMPIKNFSTEIWCDSKVHRDSYGNRVIPINLPQSNSGRNLFGTGVPGIFSFYLRLIFFAGKTKSKLKLRQNESVVWTRHPLTLIFIYKSRKVSKILLEFHQSPNFLDRQLTRLYFVNKPLQIIGITDKSVHNLRKLFPKAELVKAEMGVPGEYLLDPSSALPEQIRIGYVGKGTSSGNDNNLKLLIEGFSQVKSLDAVLEFVGLEPQIKLELKELSRSLAIPDEKISFVDHISHEKIRHIFADLSIGLIPYEWNDYNSHRFPIKLVEYAAAGLWIISDGTFAEGLGLTERLVRKYDTGNSQDFAEKVQSLCTQIALNPIRNEYAINFARERTYSKRAELITREILRERMI